MNTLPKGYYAIRPESEGDMRDTFTYRGVTYAVTAGENLFADVFAAACAANEAPDEVLEGLPYGSFSAPVLLFTAGEHRIDKFVFEKSLIWLGEGAGIDPNVRNDDPLLPPGLSPLRAGNESVLKGSYWFGKVRVDSPEVSQIIIDGFSCDKMRFIDGRTSGGHVYVSFRNVIHAGSCGNTLYYFSQPSASCDLEREVEMINIRLRDFDGLDYGGIFMEATGKRVVLDGICFDTTDKVFGFTDIPREYQNCLNLPDGCEYVIKNSYFRSLDGEHGISFGTRSAGDTRMTINIEDCVFVNASRPGEAPLQPQLGKNTELTVSRCIFEDTRDAAPSMIKVCGTGTKVCTVKCLSEGFSGSISFDPPVPVHAPEYIDASAGVTDTEDPHTVIGNADFSAVDALYAGRQPYYGDLHVHTDCGGTSDGKTPMKDYPGEMDRISLDFAAVVDHRQMRGFFLPEWDEEKFIIGTEPGTAFLDLNAVRHGQREVHYNMLFPHKYGLAMVLANFPEFEFRGDELNGSFRYPKFTKARFRELTEYVQSIGGIMVHPHPKTMLASDDPTDYYFGEHMFIETIYGSPATHASFKNYDLWLKLLDLGLHVYTSGGSDSHGKVSNKAVAVFYTSEKSGRAFFDQMHTADFTVGCIGMKMCIDGHPMGSEIGYRPGQVLTLRLGDFYGPAKKKDTAYEVRIYSDRGLVYASAYNGELPQQVALEVKERRFYRAEVFDITHGYRVAVGNPIWLDQKNDNNEKGENEY